ncbi:MAG: deoxyribonuclease IV [Candidatus Moranbacteria bacterium]|jgi:deoxyribonuclease-4|nr:deoxyribonuclease IV [Candidatus Moranbacteria bacterium]MDX9855850.1 deoxyribonuclease IV [Candidatus Moranbacteria bacterium]
MHIGCHVSIAGGIENAPQRASDLGCEAMQIFTRSPQGGKAPNLTDKICKEFKILNSKFKIKEVYIHTPYYINFASANNRIRYGSVSVVRDELERGSLIGAKYAMTHLGTAKELGEKEAVDKTIEMLKKTLEGYEGSCKLLLENSAGAGAIIGDDLKELKEIIDGVGDRTIAGICLDTQHSFASGYDWTDFKKNIERIDKELGLNKIKLFHANDSLAECGSQKDRHAHIGEGLIGAKSFSKIVRFAEKNNVDMILETRHDKVKEDIEKLKSFRLQG